MFRNLNVGAIGISGLTLAQTIQLAKETRFEGVDFSIREGAELANAHGTSYLRSLFSDAGMRLGAWAPPVDWRGDEDKWKADLEALPAFASLAAELGANRASTWILSGSDEFEFEANKEWHVNRLRPVSEVLKAEGISFGLEFLGPRTLKESFRYPYISDMEGMLQLAADIGTGNVGLLLDAWHWHTAGGTVAQLQALTAEQVVVVHVNDAPPGLTMAEYQDHDRRLPVETGVIDLEGFMRALATLGYAGPVTPEPFSKRVNAIEDPVSAAQLTAEHMDRLWSMFE